MKYYYIPHITLALLLCSCSRSSPKLTPVTIPSHTTAASHVQVAATNTSSHQEEHISALEALATLVEGNERFIRGTATHPSQDITRRSSLASGQKPKAIVLSCSDSRVPPEVVFDQGLGDIFVVRTAGEVADPVAVASMEYAVEHLGAKLIVVMGHSSCGAVKAALTTPNGSSAGSPNLDILINEIKPFIKDFPITYTSQEPTLKDAVRANINGVAKSLSLHSHILKHELENNEIKIVQAMYNLDSGKVDFWF